MGNKPSVRKRSLHADDSSATPVDGLTFRAVMEHKHVRPEQAPRLRTPLDQKITNAIKERWHDRSQRVKEKESHLTRILLKLPQAAAAFNSVRSTFQAYDKENRGYIEFNDLYIVFEQLGANFSAEEISQVFKESDMMMTGKLNFNEFLLCLAIGFVLHKIPSLEGEHDQLSIFYAPMSRVGNRSASSQSILFGKGNKLRLAFQLAVDAFLWFDVDGDGVINRAEMSAKLQNSMALHSPTRKMSANRRNKDAGNDSSNQAIWEQRFMEMDWNGDGTIHFKEFLMAFEFWVGLEEEMTS
ncbi:probable calcium-binding protein cml21-like isoform x2 [Plasmopara halstedii]|uniref:Probable calcium-binding protein cml21-like isoform x2 n=1 Tax=Plasmopara halstedii TaxID=4781 RepID=A0A0P1A904_PLAHL|nr:probable calcium-binding protein cml21-like isoform x2 [Plasmopara halstedii]CEG37224.1 probable calcium-binding protein cml21-like isoform x2 [Plasmopara halstedii]|eukprot:XP_024573593.1 probable calcium-binding protein cml21-like isoform x2 [Plasmopara halstedii]